MLKKATQLIFIIFTLSLVVFYFWGSSSSHDIDDYNQIQTYNSNTVQINKDTFSLVTFNIGYLSGMTNNTAVERPESLIMRNLEKSVDLFQRIKPDFISFQEIDFDASRSFNFNQAHAIALNASFNYTSTCINWNKKYVPFPYWPISSHFGKTVSGQAIASQYPIIENSSYTLARSKNNTFYYDAFYLDRLAQISTIDMGLIQLIIINVHLEAFDSETRNIQIQEVLGIYHQYSETNPVILCGDFNSTPPNATNPYQDDNVIESLLEDTQIEMAIDIYEDMRNEVDYFTFNSESPIRRIDYIFFNPEFITCIDSRVLNEAGQISDHLPVWMKFTFNSTKN